MGFYNWFNKRNKEMQKDVCRLNEINFSRFKIVTDYIYEHSGITDLDKRALTASRLQQFAIEVNIFTTDDFLIAMKNDNKFYQSVINITTVNETFFLREVKELEWLVEFIKNSTKKLKILSIPSSSGEEIYSILLMMCREGIDINKVELSGYDINSDVIDKAIEGIYNEYSLHKLDKQLKESYFTKVDDNKYKISSELRKSVNFSQKNIFNIEDEKEKYDIVLSRNMFIYFDNEKRKIALDIILNILKMDGTFIKGHADHINNNPNLNMIKYGIYKKV